MSRFRSIRAVEEMNSKMTSECCWCIDCGKLVFPEMEDIEEKHYGHQLVSDTKEIAEILPFGGECGGG